MTAPREPISRRTTFHITAVIVLTALNAAICWRLFKTEYIDHFDSNEGSAIAIARYISGHWGQFSWWPLWHCGMPYQDTYVPLLHLAVAAVASLAHIPTARAYHALVAVTYLLGPGTLYLMASRLGAQPGAAFLAGLSYSLLSPSAFLMPNVARDIGGLWQNRRLQVLTVYGEGPHISAMTLIPVVILALEYAINRRTGRALAFAAISVALVFLTNVPGSMALGLAVFCWICAQPSEQHALAWLIGAMAAVLAYGLACYGLPPSSVATVLHTVGPMHSGFSNSLQHGPWALVATLGAAAAIGYVLSRTRMPLVVRFAFLNFGVLVVLVLTAKSGEFEMLPQVGRLHLEMEMGICVVMGTAAWASYRRMPRTMRPVLVLLCLALVFAQYRNYRRQSRALISYADPSAHSEYTSARWLDAHGDGGRVYVTGSTSFWLNAFTDTPQLIGCCDQGQSMPVLVYLPYIVNDNTTLSGTEDSKTWLQAMGVDALVVNGPDSTDQYKGIRLPERFEGVLPVLHREHGDTIYAIPGRHSLAHVLRPADLAPLRPGQQVQFADVKRYAAAITDDSLPGATFEWLQGGTARIRTNLRKDNMVSVQVAWFRGWKASVHQQSIPVSADGLGFLLLKPGCEGPCEITLSWTGRPDQPFAAGISILALAGVALLMRHDTQLPLRVPIR